MPGGHLKTTSKSSKSETIKPFLSSVFFALACERISIKKQEKKKKHSIEGRCVIGPENILFAGASVHLSAQTFYRLGQ